MAGVVSQTLAIGQPASGFTQRDRSPGNLGLTNYGLQSASFTSRGNGSYIFPAGGTVVLPTPTGSGNFLVLVPFGVGTFTLSGTQTVNGTTLSSFVYLSNQTLLFTDSSSIYGWV